MTTATTAVQNVMNAVGSLISVGCSVAVTFGLISKMIQIIRFMNIGYSSRLKDILLTWGTDILNLNIPRQIDEKIMSHDISSLFSVYGIEPSFLSNFWGMIVILLGAASSWVLCKVLLYSYEQCWKSRDTLIHGILRWLCKAALNFLVVSVYGGFGDVVFFTVLEMKSLVLVSVWSCVSFTLSVFFMLLGVCFICLHWSFLLKYKKLRLQSSTVLPQALEEFTRKYEFIAVLYEDFSDSTLFKHGFLFVGVARDIAISLIITTLSSLPLFQSVLLSCCSLLMCIYLLFNNPFRHRFEQASQIFLELCVFIVYISVTTIAVLDSHHTSADIDRDRLGSVIITMNIIINSGCALLMGVKILQQVWNTYKIYSQKKNRKVHTARNIPSLNPNSQSDVPIKHIGEESVADHSLLQQSVLNDSTGQTCRLQLRGEQIGRSQFLGDSSVITMSGINNIQGSVLKTEDSATYISKTGQPLSKTQAPTNISEGQGNLNSMSRPDPADEDRNGLNQRRTLEYSNGNRKNRRKQNNNGSSVIPR